MRPIYNSTKKYEKITISKTIMIKLEKKSKKK
jgi:hypothetical protein